MKRFHRRCRRLCILAALLVLLVLFLRQNVLLDTASRHAILLDAQSGQVLAQKRADERTAPASLTKMMTILLAIETEPDLDKQVTLPEDIFQPYRPKSIYGRLCARGDGHGAGLALWCDAAFRCRML